MALTTIALWALIVALVLGIAVAAIGTVSASPGYPWNNLVVLLTALSAVLLLGRVLLPRFAPMLAVMLALSVLDIAQIALTRGLTPLAHRTPQASAPVTYLNLGLLLPWGRFAIGICDILIIAMLAEHWCRRGTTFILALLPGIIGYALAHVFILITQMSGLPLIPFFTAGWLCTEGLFRAMVGAATSRQPA